MSIRSAQPDQTLVERTAREQHKSAIKLPNVGVVVIGRNEGDRLKACLRSVVAVAPARIVYVDSGSTDQSLEFASSIGVTTVALDRSAPFTAARARNQGVKALLGETADIGFIQFIDGDCQMHAAWLALAYHFLDQHPDIAAVSGRRREQFPDVSVYNLICDIEWDTPVGLTKAFGGDVLCRADVFRTVGGYQDSIIAGEDTEFGVRIRSAGWKIWRLDAEMTTHDAAMHKFSQWWKRSTRTGYAYAEGARLHGSLPEKHFVKQLRSSVLWGFGMVGVGLLSVAYSPWLLLALFMLLVGQTIRIWRNFGTKRRGALPYALSNALGKLPEAFGVMRYLAQMSTGQAPKIIEYK
jgi:GT2 family glycosyltransferase